MLICLGVTLFVTLFQANFYLGTSFLLGAIAVFMYAKVIFRNNTYLHALDNMHSQYMIYNTLFIIYILFALALSYNYNDVTQFLTSYQNSSAGWITVGFICISCVIAGVLILLKDDNSSRCCCLGKRGGIDEHHFHGNSGGVHNRSPPMGMRSAGGGGGGGGQQFFPPTPSSSHSRGRGGGGGGGYSLVHNHEQHDHSSHTLLGGRGGSGGGDDDDSSEDILAPIPTLRRAGGAFESSDSINLDSDIGDSNVSGGGNRNHSNRGVMLPPTPAVALPVRGTGMPFEIDLNHGGRQYNSHV